MKIQFLLAFFIGSLQPQLSLMSQYNDCLSVRQETQVLSKGSKQVFKCDIYYNKEKDAVITHHFYPVEFVKMSNRFGEMKIYFPKTNTVTVKQNESFSTTNELLYYFINNKLTDMGLAKEGFTLVNTSHEEGMMITDWQAPSGKNLIDQIKMVYKDMLPVYAEYIDINGTVMKKIYYGKYADFKTFSLPLRITEVAFKTPSDSTISLSVFSDVVTNDFPENNYFNFKIPDDAKISK